MNVVNGVSEFRHPRAGVVAVAAWLASQRLCVLEDFP